MIFALEFPAWTRPDGFPLSWRHFTYGMSAIARAHLRRAMALAEGVRMGGAVQDDFDRFTADINRMTEAPRDG